MVEIHLKGPIYRALLKQCCLYPQAPILKVGPTPSGLWLRALDALQIRHEPGPSPEGTEVLDTSAGEGPVASAIHQPLQSWILQAEGVLTAELSDQGPFAPEIN